MKTWLVSLDKVQESDMKRLASLGGSTPLWRRVKHCRSHCLIQSGFVRKGATGTLLIRHCCSRVGY